MVRSLNAEAQSGFQVIGNARQGEIIAGNRLVEPLQRMQRNAAIIKQSRVRWVCDCPVDQSEGCRRIVVLKLNRAQTDAGLRRLADSVREFSDTSRPLRQSGLFDQGRGSFKHGTGPHAGLAQCYRPGNAAHDAVRFAVSWYHRARPTFNRMTRSS